MSAFTTALSALQAASAGVESVSNNLANMTTTAYKRGRVSFQEMIAGAGGSDNPGAGVTVAEDAKNFVQGSVQPTTGLLDAAIDGPGFFIVKGGAEPGATVASGEMLLTRDGRFRVGSDGGLLTSSGDQVQGWNLDTSTGTISTAGPLEDIVIPLGTTTPAQATQTFSIGTNLDAASPDGAVVNAPLRIHDADGGVHIFQVTFTKQSADTWGISLSTADPAVQQPLPSFSATSLSFVNGQLDPATPADITIGPIDFTPESGLASLPQLSWDVLGSTTTPLITQHSRSSIVTSVTQDGRAEAAATGARIVDGGKVLVQYSDGVESEIGRLALSSVRNPDTLVAAGDNAFRLGSDTFIMPPAESGSSGYGDIAGNSLELSNVDLAQELTQLLTYQRSYQANARTITTADELAQETLSLKR